MLKLDELKEDLADGPRLLKKTKMLRRMKLDMRCQQLLDVKVVQSKCGGESEARCVGC